jgi:hypothetical protein
VVFIWQIPFRIFFSAHNMEIMNDTFEWKNEENRRKQILMTWCKWNYLNFGKNVVLLYFPTEFYYSHRDEIPPVGSRENVQMRKKNDDDYYTTKQTRSKILSLKKLWSFCIKIIKIRVLRFTKKKRSCKSLFNSQITNDDDDVKDLCI